MDCSTNTFMLTGRIPAVRSAQITTCVAGASHRVKLGTSDLHVSECCLGTMTWGVQNTEQEAHEQLSYAIDQGINFIDTAEMYPIPPSKETQGRTDRYIASWLKNQKREDLILATKVAGHGNKYLREGKETRVTPSQIEQSVEDSLKRLGTDHIDLLQVHWPDRYVSLFGGAAYDPANERDDIPFDRQLRGMAAVVKSGKVRYIGVSNETSYGVMRWIQASEQLGRPRIVSIQNSYSLLVRVPFDTDLAETCAPRQCNVGLLAYSPLAGGALSGKYMSGTAPEGARLTRFPGYMERYNKSQARTATGEYMKVAEKHGISAVELALAWCKQRWQVASTIIGATSMTQLKENIGAFDIKLSEECLADVEEVYKRFRDPTIR
ncbi:hypothetical protein WJX72_001597 [[Myrmecia] bisecta]|uniref:NADP-dependent oxidoreductase domain-containing protein n=1 Tax=[Myrmecia] bisecta TaxID=41462 RepID=A0AAW1Q0G6_9CHLO